MQMLEHCLKANSDVAIACHIKYLQQESDAEKLSFAWTSLGHIFMRHMSEKAAKLCFKKSTKVGSKLSRTVLQWKFLGPFVIGKTEVDGDPLEAYGGIWNVSKYRFDKNKPVYYSELRPNKGAVRWQALVQSKMMTSEDEHTVQPDIDWNDVIQGLGSLAITEWQGWVVGEIAVNENGMNIIIQCSGVHTVYVNRIPVTSDIYRRKQFWFAHPVQQGIATVALRLRTKVAARFNCQFDIAKKTFEILEIPYLPDIWDGHLFGGLVSIPMANYHTSKWITNIRVKLADTSESRFDVTTVSNHAVAPGQVKPVIIELLPLSDPLTFTCSEVDVKLKLTTSAGQSDVTVSLKCRQRGESFLFTFLDHDGSVQHAAAVAPLQPCAAAARGRCPVLLTLHGTTVPPRQQADSYKRWQGGRYVFGLDAAWVLAPTRHGAHNWEGPGSLTALAALDRFIETVNKKDWISDKVSTIDVIIAGHSMGGHGALHLATHWPDRALGLIALASWNRKEEYGDSNLFFKHDVSNSHVDSEVKAVLEATVAENEADKHLSNLKGMPVFLRIGVKDRTVHPFYTRRLMRVLKEEQVNVTYHEIKDKEHWWWDTWETNDGGAVNDPQIRNFTSYVASTAAAQEGQCSKADDNCGVTTNRYRAADDERFKLTVVNPAFHGPLRGIQVLQQTTPFRKSTVEVTVRESGVAITTVNVARLSIKPTTLRPVPWQDKTLTLDEGTEWPWSAVKTTLEHAGKCFCHSKGVWSLCGDCESYVTEARSLQTMGPMRRVAEAPFIIVTGSLNDEVFLRHLGVYIANLFYLNSDSYAPIVLDKDVTEKHLVNTNIISIGNSLQNSLTDRLMTSSPIRKGMKLGSCTFSHAHTGIATLTSHAPGRLALVLLGNSNEGLLDAASLATPTIPPMTRSPFSNLLPDFVVTGPEYRQKGPAGYLCAGFYDNSWQLRPDLVSCSHCVL